MTIPNIVFTEYYSGPFGIENICALVDDGLLLMERLSRFFKEVSFLEVNGKGS